MKIEERKNYVISIFTSLDNKEFDKFRTLLIDNSHPDVHINKMENTGSRIHKEKSFEQTVEGWIRYNEMFENNYNILYLIGEGDRVGAFVEVTQVLLGDWQLETISKIIPKGSQYTLLQFHGFTFKDGRLYTMDRVADWVKRDIGWGIISDENKDEKISAYFHHLEKLGLVPFN